MEQSPGQQKEIDLSGVFSALENPLGLIDNADRRADIQRYLESARIHLERAVFDLLSEAVTAVNDAGGVRARLEYQAGKLILVVESSGEGEAEAEPESEPESERLFNVEGDMEKVTIRIPAELKDLIHQAASLGGVSANSWYIRELGRSISHQVRHQMREQARQARRGGREERRRSGTSLKGFIGD